MRHAYRPVYDVPKGCEASPEVVEFVRQLQQRSDARHAGVEWEIVDSVLPVSGGKGFRCQWYRNGQPVERKP